LRERGKHQLSIRKKNGLVREKREVKKRTSMGGELSP